MAARAIITLALLVAAANATLYSAFVRADGSIVPNGQPSTLNVTRIDTGVYCFNKVNTTLAWFNYAAVSVTPQVGAKETPAIGMANTGYGNRCNPYGGAQVKLMDTLGLPVDQDFTVIVVEQ